MRETTNCDDLSLWPEHALIAARHGADAPIDELLHALTLVGFGRVEIALGIGRKAVHAVELARLASAVAERGYFLERVAHNDADTRILAVRQHDEFLIGILGERDVPYRSRAARVLGVKLLLHEG